ncbi:hypothetical protein BDV18DRAFT_49796 [Aspergillus unguis]
MENILSSTSSYSYSLSSSSFAVGLPAAVSNGWARIVDTHSPVAIEFFGSIAVQIVAFWIPVSLFTLMDVLGPERIPWRKIQPEEKQPVPTHAKPEEGKADYAAIKKGYANCFLNQILTTSIHIAVLAAMHFSGAERKTIFLVDREIPALGTVVKQIAVSLVLQEGIFYHAHRALHHPRLYKIHKKHHEFSTPIALAALYAHPIEYIMSNIIPVALPPFLVGGHILTFWFMLAGALFQALISHSGYYLPPVVGWTMIVHDLHHEFSGGNYGIMGVCDFLYGTRFTSREEKVQQRKALGAGKAKAEKEN